MATTNERLRTYWAERDFDGQRLASVATRYWEIALVGALVAVALILRLWDLDGRAVHHDESIHMWYSWLLVEGNGYTHDPVYHGPFEIVGTAGIFRIFGDSDFTGRLLPALFGTALVGLPYFLRSYLGRIGTFAAVGLLAFSPAILYFSRFARNDIYIAVFTLGIAILIWRYLKEQKDGYLLGIALLLALSFTTKEMTYITSAMFLVYLEYHLATDLIDQLRASRQMRPNEVAFAYIVLMPTAWLVAAVWPLIEGVRKRWSLSELPAAGALLIVMGTLSLPQFSAGIQKLPGGIFNDGGYMGEATLMRVTVLLLIIATAYVGLIWKPRVWAMAAALFYIPFFVLFTTFLTNGGDVWNIFGGDFWGGSGATAGGFWTGTWGSLDYWLGQQSVARGGQPDYYYFMFLPIYEFLPLVFALGGVLYYAFRGKLEHQLLTASALLLIIALNLLPDSIFLIGDYRIELSFIIAIGAALALPIEAFTKFLLFWALTMLFAVTLAGEKMPWLTVHLALPLALLAAKILNDVFSSFGRRAPAAPAQEEPPPEPDRSRKRKQEVERPPATALEPLVPLLLAAAFALAAAILFQWFGPTSGASLVAWPLAFAALGTVLWAANSISWQTAGHVAVVALFAALFVFTVRAGGIAAFDQGDRGGVPQELLIYAQGSPDLGALRDDIVQFAEESGKGHDLQIFHESGINDWPWPWYLRDYAYGYTDVSAGFVPEPGSVALIGSTNEQQVEPYLDSVLDSESYRHMWWFPERYKGLDTAGFLGDTFSGGFASTWRGYFIDRELSNAIETPDRIVYFFGTEPIEAIEPEFAGVIDQQSQTLIGEPGAGPGQFDQPADMALDADGNLFVVDTLNQRVLILAPDGTFIDSFGEAGSGPGQFSDPSDADSQYAADGPWGIEIDRDGNVYVADTWNHRIQKFGPDFEFILEWGGGGELFGPRDIAIDSDGNILVVDTGNKRIVKYTPDGEQLEEFGGEGGGPGQFNEPSSITVASTGDIYVADYWNRRVQHFDPEMTYLDEFRVSTWGSRGVTDRAYIIALDDGSVLATDPANSQLVLYDAAGTWQAALSLGAETTTRPIGIIMNEGGQVYIADSLGSQVRRIPLDALLTTQADPLQTPTTP